MRKTHYLTLSAGILSLVCYVSLISITAVGLYGTYVMVSLGDVLDAGQASLSALFTQTGILLLVTYIFEMVYSITLVVLSCLCIRSSTHESYLKNKALLVAVVILNTIMSIIGIVCTFVLRGGLPMTILQVIIFAVLLLSAALILADVVKSMRKATSKS